MNNNHEYLFWKIIRNKYLINKIFNYIQSIEWVKYNNHKQLHIDNRLKFKNTYSLNLMIKNKLYSFLNYKLDNNEYIHICNKSITTLFNQLSIDNIINNNDDTNTIKDILIKILEKKRYEFEIQDLTLEAVKCNSIEVLRILINEPYSMIVYPSTLEYAIKNSHPIIVEEILKVNSYNSLGRDNNKAFNEIKRISFYLSNYNSKYLHGMVDLVLHKFNLSIPTDNTNLSDYYHSNKERYFLNSFFEKSNNPIELSFKDTLLIYQFFNNNKEEQQDYSNLSLKELQTLIILKLKNSLNGLSKYSTNLKFYLYFIAKYKEIIDECHEKETTTPSIFYKQGENAEQILKYQQFLKILNIKSDHSSDTMDIIKNDIINDCYNGKLVWNELLCNIILSKELGLERIVINDKSTVDWILNCKNKSILSIIIKDNLREITFATLELADWVYKESGLVNHIYSSNNEMLIFYKPINIYYHVWNEAIKQLDFSTISYIESLNIQNLKEITKYSSIQTIDQLNSFINYYNKTKFYSCFYRLFFDHIISVFNDHQGDDQSFSNNIIQLNFENDYNYINNEIIPLFTNAINCNNFKLVELLLVNSNIFINCFNKEEEQQQHYENFTDHFNQISKFIFSKKNTFTDKEINKDEIIELIIKILKKIKNKSDDGQLGLMETNNPISILVNYFFEKLIQIQGVTMNDVKQVYQLIKQQSITIEHGLYHLYYYLHIKDIEYTYLIIRNPFIIEILFKQRYYRYYCCNSFQSDWVYLEDYLKPSEFTFEIINNVSFDQMLQMLLDKLSPLINRAIYDDESSSSSEDEIHQKINDTINWELKFYLIIKRNDLFFKKLDNQFINNQPPYSRYIFKLLCFEEICKVLELDEIKIIIKLFNNEKEFLNNLIQQSLSCDSPRFDIAKLLLDNFKSIDLILNLDNFCEKGDFESFSFLFNNQYINFKKHIKHLKRCLNLAFSFGKIKLFQIILSSLDNCQFFISEKAISNSMGEDHIYIIIYLLKYHKNMIKELFMDRLKSYINQHESFKYLNIFS